MATLTVGDGKTYSNIIAAHAAANDADTIEIYRQAGDAAYAENTLTITKGVTIVGMYDDLRIVTNRSRVINIGAGGAINGTLTISKINLGRSAYALGQTSGNVIFDRCIFSLIYSGYVQYGNYTRTGTVTFRNCLFLHGYTAAFRAVFGSGGNLVFQNCTFKGQELNILQVTIGTYIDDVLIQNCDAIGGSDPWGGITGVLNANSGYNASSSTTTAGGNNLINKTLEDGDYIGAWSLPMGILNTSDLYHVGTLISGITTDIFGITRHPTTPSIGCFEGNYFTNPNSLNVIENTDYYYNKTYYSGIIPNSSVLSGISSGTLVLDYSSPNNTLDNDTTSGVQGQIPVSAVLSGIGAGTFIPDYASPANLLNNDTSSGVQGLIDPSYLLSGIGAGTLVVDYASPENLLNVDTTSGVQGQIDPAYLFSGIGVGTYVPDHPSESRVVSGIVYDSGSKTGQFIVPTQPQTQLNVKFGYQEEYTGEFVGATIAVTTPTISVSLTNTTATITFSSSYAGATNYLYMRDETNPVNDYILQGSREGDGTITVSGLTRGKHYTFSANSKVGSCYSNTVISDTIIVSRVPASGEEVDHTGGWYTGITDNLGDNASTSYYESSHDDGWYDGIQDTGGDA